MSSSTVTFKEIPTDSWLSNLVVQASSTDTMLLVGNYMKDKKVVVKLVMNDNNNEYKVLSLIDKTKIRFKNLHVIYGNGSCYEKKDVLQTNYERIKGRGMCYGSKDDGDSVKIYFSIISYIDGMTLEQIGSSKLPDEQVISLVMQGMMTIYQLFYVFGIMHRDFNAGNIIVKPTNDKTIEYKIKWWPYRYFPFEYKDDNCYINAPSYAIETKGVRLYLIDFDNATVYHHDYRNADVTHTVIEEVDRFLMTMLRYGSKELQDKYLNIQDLLFQRGKQCCQRHHDRYNNNKTQETNEFMLERCTVSLRAYCHHVAKAFGFPFGFRF